LLRHFFRFVDMQNGAAKAGFEMAKPALEQCLETNPSDKMSGAAPQVYIRARNRNPPDCFADG
jgi:hypothetical protein